MKLFVVRETESEETRAPIVPRDAGELAKLGAQIEVEGRIGQSIGIADSAYEEVGARISGDRQASLSAAEMVLRMSVPGREDIRLLSEGCIHVSYLAPFENSELVKELVAAKISAVSLEMIPRTNLAQMMDVLS